MKVPSTDGGIEPRLAFVVFSGDSDLKRVKGLKPGFRHCFVVLEADGGWIILDPLCHWTELSFFADVPIWDVLAVYCRHGYKVLPRILRPVPRRPAPWGPFTCVEAVKRVLGIHARTVITPWNLYKFLINKNI